MGSSASFWVLLWVPLSSFLVLLLLGSSFFIWVLLLGSSSFQVLPLHLGSVWGPSFIWALLWAPLSSFRVLLLGSTSCFGLCFWAPLHFSSSPPPPFGFSFGLLPLHFTSFFFGVLPLHLGSAFGLLSFHFGSSPLLLGSSPFGAALGSSLHLESLAPPSSFRFSFGLLSSFQPLFSPFGLLSLHFSPSPPFRSSLSIWALLCAPPPFRPWAPPPLWVPPFIFPLPGPFRS